MDLREFRDTLLRLERPEEVLLLAERLHDGGGKVNAHRPGPRCRACTDE